MKRVDAEQLLGGHATGTLTESERRTLYAAALEHQAIFDALMDEEALQELLADPEAKAQLLAALAPAVAPKIVPFWRRTGVLGAAASLLLASLAGLAYLRSPSPLPPLEQREAAKAPAAKAVAVPPVVQAPAVPVRKGVPAEQAKEAATPLMAAPATGVSAAVVDAAREKAREYRRAEAQDTFSRKDEAPRPAAAAVMEVAGALAPAPLEKKAKATGGIAPGLSASPAGPVWILEPQPDGTTRVTITAPRGPQALILKRGASGIEVLRLQATEDRGHPLVQWRGRVRLAAGDVLDLYLMNGPVADPARLPETGPVDGFRARIHPAAK